MRFGTSLLILSGLALSSGPSWAQLRVATWNVTNYTGGRTVPFQTAIYGIFEGRTMAPDVLVGQEFRTAAAMWEFNMLLNTAPGSPGDWMAGPFIDGPDTDNVIFYRTSKVRLLATSVIAQGGGTNDQPRDTTRYDIQPRLEEDGPFWDRSRSLPIDGATIAIYSSHMKAGSTSDDQARRLIEAERIRDNAAILPASWHYMVVGDFNIQSSNQAAYQKLTEFPGDPGRFFDPISTPGSWNNNSSFRFVHTQDPAGQMDDRLDFMLLSPNLIDADAMDYIGNPSIPYSTTTWDDPNHSYRSWGNDGTSFDALLKVTGNAMVGPTIAQALRDSQAAGGHLPVFLDLKVPPTLGDLRAPSFRDTTVGVSSSALVEIRHVGNVRRWTTKGIAPLRYSLSTSGPFTAPAGTFTLGAGPLPAWHRISVDSSSAGLKQGTLTISSNDPSAPVRTVRLTALVNP